MEGSALTERVRSSELGDALRRRLGIEDGADIELEITVRRVTGEVRQKAGRVGFLEAKQRLGLPDVDPEERDAELKADRDAWKD